MAATTIFLILVQCKQADGNQGQERAMQNEALKLSGIWSGGPLAEEVSKLLGVEPKREYFCFRLDAEAGVGVLRFVSNPTDFDFRVRTLPADEIEIEYRNNKKVAKIQRDPSPEEHWLYLHFKNEKGEYDSHYEASTTKLATLEECIKERQAYLNIHSEVGPPPKQ